MDHILLYLLLFPGLLSLTLCIQSEYILIKIPATWYTAQTYCRKHHTDLATVQSSENWTLLQEAATKASYFGFAWIGLYNDINGWRWSYNEESPVFQSWAIGQPDNYGYGQECVVILPNGDWHDTYCTDSRYFVCYDESSNTTEKMVLRKSFKTWSDAQKYCRDHYTDLAIITSQADQNKITRLITLYPAVWIGLYRETWKWSDQSNVTSSTQNYIQVFTRWNENCAGLNYYNYIDDRPCVYGYYFYCNTVRRRRLVVRVQVKSANTVNEAILKTLVLNKLQQTLGGGDVIMKWRTQPDKKVFQKMWIPPKRIEANTSFCEIDCPFEE